MSLDEGYSIVPAGIEAIDPDDELAAQEALAAQTTLTPTSATATLTPLGRAPAYDFIARRFIPGTAGGPLNVTGVAALEMWVEKCLRTRRRENPAVDPAFGVSVLGEDLLDGGVLDDSALAEAYDDWREALLRHPRISDVDVLRIAPGPQDDFLSVYIRCTLNGIGNQRVAIDGLLLPLGGN